MGHALFNASYSQASDANFRAWLSSFKTGLLAAGWVQTTDTGQADVTTAVKPTSTSQAAASFLMFRFDDALQATYPLFVKLQFGTNSTSSDYPTMWLTVGKGTDGAGNVTGILFNDNICAGAYNTNPYTTGQPCAAGFGEGWLAFLGGLGTNPSGNRGFPHIVIERSRDAAGNPTGSGVAVIVPPTSYAGVTYGTVTSVLIMFAVNYATGAYFRSLVPVSVPGSINGTNLGSTTSMASGSIGPVFPIVALAPGVAPWQLMSVVSIPVGDLPGGVFETTLLGHTVQMMPCAPNSTCAWGLAVVSENATVVNLSNQVGVGLKWDE